MKSKLIWIVLGAIVLALGFGVFAKKGPSREEKATLSQESLLPYAQVVRGKLYALDADEKTKIKEISSGESIPNGTILGTDPNSKANIHFADGSVLRMDQETRATIVAGTYDPNTGKLTARISLLWGNVWSKIIGLATPDSMWEVSTPHAVATVRGTAFGSSYTKGKTNFIGGEHTVAVKIKDPKTKLELPVQELAFAENQTIEIGDTQTTEIAKAALSGTTTAAVKAETLVRVRTASASSQGAPWIQEAKREDAALDLIIKEWSTTGGTKVDLQNFIREELNIRINTSTQSKTAPATIEITPAKTQTTESVPIKTTTAPILKQAEQIIVPENAKLVIVETTAKQAIFEGETLQFAAYLVSPEGARKQLTTGVVWSTSGLVGSIQQNGLFTAKLHPEVAEIGEATGTVKASFKDPSTGKLFEAESVRFVVSAPAPNETEVEEKAI